MPAGSGGRHRKRLVKCGLSARKSSCSRFTVPQWRHTTRRTSSSRTIRNPALDRSRTCRTRRSYQPSRTRAQQPQTVFLSADQAARSAHSDHRIHHVRSLSLESPRTNIHPTDAAVASPIRPSLSVPKSSDPPSLRKPLSTSFSAAMIPQNHPLDSLKTHHYGDTEFVALLETDAKSIASDLIGHISKDQQKAWQAGTPSDWAKESFQIAKADAYGLLSEPSSRGSYRLSEKYIKTATADVALQLSKAGVRLAFLLNNALRNR